MDDKTRRSCVTDLPPLRDIIRDHSLRAEKKLGQNFLLDLQLTDKIVRAAGDLTDTHVIEIGPGPGGLTRALVASPARSVSAVEYDQRAVAALQSLIVCAQGRLRVVADDALGCDVTELAPPPRAIVANLPYNIATPLLLGWLRQIRTDPNAFRSMTLMFQREVAERISAAPGSKIYGRLSVMTQWVCTVERALLLPPSAFTPPPKVHSMVLHMRPQTVSADDPSFNVMERVVAAAFGQRRKMLRSSLRGIVHDDRLAAIGDERRAETLSVDEFRALALSALPAR